MAPGPPRRPVTNVVRADGRPPEFRTHGKGRGRAHVIVAKGRWLIVCPMCGQRDPGLDEHGEAVRETVCSRCGNGAAGGRVLDVLWPSNRKRAHVEAILSCRVLPDGSPDLEHRNWQPWESIGMLAMENINNGCAVPQLLPIVSVDVDRMPKRG